MSLNGSNLGSLKAGICLESLKQIFLLFSLKLILFGVIALLLRTQLDRSEKMHINRIVMRLPHEINKGTAKSINIHASTANTLINLRNRAVELQS